jgi:hypothetical protein
MNYEGEFSMGTKEGKGKFYYKKTEEYYEGEVFNNIINGKGFYRWNNQHSYQGTFLDSQMHGNGLYSWPDGGEYTGEYRYNIKEGQGVFKWPSGKIYQGPFSDGVPHGKGTLLMQNNQTCFVEFNKGKLIMKYVNTNKSKEDSNNNTTS